MEKVRGIVAGAGTDIATTGGTLLRGSSTKSGGAEVASHVAGKPTDGMEDVLVTMAEDRTSCGAPGSEYNAPVDPCV